MKKTLISIFLMAALLLAGFYLTLWLLNQNTETGFEATLKSEIIKTIDTADVYYTSNGNSYIGFSGTIPANILEECGSTPITKISNDGQSISVYTQPCRSKTDEPFLCIYRESGTIPKNTAKNQFFSVPKNSDLKSTCI